ncbi:MAG TPA: TAT-variant-translocated molybdopterin oxidoreductase [Blastocatellia bacterium]|nr:TAT-variant-translocated molybdopterin oxidoreductase [Blastocatellia bacterium]HMX25099.1 TAT-variant-translocated molybdopterin oxidoreductase [Blastocatellia bacterium]HMY73322.1 TAT-variant-translocated molybdopterin oxidoreductase [Blastocatellia bacterium]HNG31930.1 TAT-variant-translocated molybdopterin oxidoreductase [Blastocatellia bacterium]
MSHRDHHHDLEPIREKLRRKTGREFWRSLEEMAGTDNFRDFLHREFPSLNAPDTDPSLLDPSGRRNFMKLMGASLALAGLTACTRQPKENVVPYVKNPEGLVPGKTQFYATAMPLSGVASGLLVESHEGRPTKIEGNLDHPASLGATDIFAQASVLQLYDPDRSQSALKLGDPRTWGDFLNELRTWLDGQRIKQGEGIRILTETLTSPTLAAQMKAVLAMFPKAKWVTYEPNSRDGARMGAQAATGQFVNTVYKFENAEVVLSLDADFLTNGPGSVRYAREFINKRRLTGGKQEMNRLYVAESTLTTTGAKADHRLPLKAGQVDAFARQIANAVGVAVPGGAGLDGEAQKFATAVAADLLAHKGKSLVIAGEHQSKEVHALALAVNNVLGNIGSTVVLTDPIEINPMDQNAAVTELIGEMNAGKVEVLLILGGNPAYNAPNLPGQKHSFLEAMKKVANRVHMGLYNDETAANCPWHIAESHYLESWGDARAFDGTVSIIQPLIEPMYQTRTAHELLAAMVNQAGKSTLDIVKDYWKTQPQMSANFDQAWKQALNDGVIAGTALPAKTVSVNAGATASSASAKSGQYEIVFRLDPHVHDGRFTNNGWLQECPKPINKVTWDNFAIISAKTAAKLSLAPNEEPYHAKAKMLKLSHDGKELSLPAWIQPGQPDDTVTVYLGYGRERAGQVGNGLGFNAYSLRTSSTPWIVADATLTAGEGTYQLASTQEHFNIDASGIETKAFIPEDNDLTERHIVRTGTLEAYKKDPHSIHHGAHKPGKELTIYPNWQYEGYAWGMAIDMNACIGCNACVVSCQSENNIAVVGKELVTRGRYMHWLRIDTYFRGGEVNPEVYFQPMLCQHCENAPCEVVCPVNATVHDAEGLNVQVYNRCVGTRYCANNCPYKVRRFNYLLYGDWETGSLKNVRNPEVTIRSRGVMEKCTFCVQRIMNAKIESEKQGRLVADGEIQTACQTVCPTEAIVFGDVGIKSNPNGQAPQTQVAKLKAEPRNYEVLADLNTRPRTSYLAPIKNPNAALGGGAAAHGGGQGEGHK